MDQTRANNRKLAPAILYCQIPWRLRAGLEDLARRDGQAVSHIVERGLSRYLTELGIDQMDYVAPQPQKRGRKPYQREHIASVIMDMIQRNEGTDDQIVTYLHRHHDRSMRAIRAVLRAMIQDGRIRRIESSSGITSYHLSSQKA